MLRQPSRLYILLGFLILTAVGISMCQKEEQPIGVQRASTPAPKTVLPKEVATDLPRANIDSFRVKSYVIYSLRPEQEDIRIFNPLLEGGVHTFKTISEVAEKEKQSIVFAMNGGMFSQDRRAQGLLVVDGETLVNLDTATSGYGNFYMQPNGVFALDKDGKAYVIPTQAYDSLAQEASIVYATQSGPMMVIDGRINAHFNDGSPNLHIRNAVGIMPDGQLVFAISREKTTFFDLSTLMIQRGCNQVLYLDGFVSRMYLPELNVGKIEDGQNLGPLIAVFR